MARTAPSGRPGVGAAAAALPVHEPAPAGAPRRMPAPGPHRVRGGAAVRDLLLVAAGTVGLWVLAGRANLLERYLTVTQRLERWQADELVFVLAGLAVGMMWYALRRWREARRAVRLHQDAEQRVGELLGHNRELAQQLISVQDNERRALARELHDELGQCCSALRAEAALVERTAQREPAAACAAARRIDAAAEGLYQTVRDMLQRLRPPDLDALGLPAAIQALCERWETSSGVACVFHHDGGPGAWRGLGDAVDVTVYRVVQEALSNVSRHAAASQVRIALRQEAEAGGAVCRVLTVQDDGRGMDPQAPPGGLGLLGARERAALLGGELCIDSAPGQGLRLTMRLPSPPAAAAPMEVA